MLRAVKQRDVTLLHTSAVLDVLSWISQDHLLPAEYVRTFRGALLDKCPISSPTEVSPQAAHSQTNVQPDLLFYCYSAGRCRPLGAAT
jgi:hypothetical protein